MRELRNVDGEYVPEWFDLVGGRDRKAARNAALFWGHVSAAKGLVSSPSEEQDDLGDLLRPISHLRRRGQQRY
jgi:hypothetical protein